MDRAKISTTSSKRSVTPWLLPGGTRSSAAKHIFGAELTRIIIDPLFIISQ